MIQIKNSSMFRSEIPSAYSEKIFRKSIDFRNRNSEFGMGQNLGIFGIRNSEFGIPSHPCCACNLLYALQVNGLDAINDVTSKIDQ